MAGSENTKKKTLEDHLQWLREKSANAKVETEQRVAETPRQMFLPGMQEFIRAMPNNVADSSLFAPVARGNKKMHTGTVLASRLNTTLTYWGVQLNELHADIAMQLLWEQQRQGVALGEPVKLNRNAFMKSMGWGNSGREYFRFHTHMIELTAAMLVIETRKPDGTKRYHIGATKTFRIVDSFECDDGGDNYSYVLDPRWVVMFGNREYALIDWSKRLQISAGQDLAKCMQRLLATSADRVQRYGLEALKVKMQYSGRIRDFRDAISRTVDELTRLEIIAKGKIEMSTKGKEQLVLWLPETA
jgi:hypothetical protein